MNYTDSFLSLFFREIHQIVKSNLSLESGIEAMLEDDKNSPCSNIHDSIVLGLSFSQALKKEGFPEHAVTMIEMAEETGRLEETSLSLQLHYEREERIKKNLKNAVMIPSAIFLVMLSILLVLIVEVLPIFKNCFNQMGLETSGFINTLLIFRNGLVNSAWIFAILLAFIALTAAVIFFNEKYLNRLKTFLNKNLKVLKSFQYIRYLSSLSVYLDNGFDEESSLEKAGAYETLDELSNVLQKYKSGESLGEALFSSGVLNKKEFQLVKLAAQTGRTSEVFDEIAKDKEKETENKLEKMISSVEPVIIITVSILAGIILLSILLPLLGVLSSW